MSAARQPQELIAQIRRLLDELEAALSAAGPAASQDERGRASPTPAGPEKPAELPNIILPTQTDNPDSIIGGSPTAFLDFQDCCAVGNDLGFFCTGTLVAPTLVVTAKHCKNINRVFLRGNDVHQASLGEIIAVVKCVPHPEAKVDLQVLVLEEPSKVRPRRLAEPEDLNGLEDVLLVGFGTINLDGTVGYGVKRQVRVPLVQLDYTPEAAGQFGLRGDYELVAGHRGLGRDSCRGDSGGPLYIESSAGGYVLLGATSRGVPRSPFDPMCGDGGVYVRVDRFRAWVMAQAVDA